VDGVIRRLPLIENSRESGVALGTALIGKSTGKRDLRNVHSTANALCQPKEADSKQETYVPKMEAAVRE
jgi:hypothetical protein